MFKKLSYDQFASLTAQHKRIAVYQEIAGDKITPVTAYLALAQSTKDITLLESSPKEKDTGRYSHLFIHPLITITTFGNQITISEQANKKHLQADPFVILKQYQQKLKAKIAHLLSKFAGGMVGYIAYDAIRLVETIPDRHENKNNMPDILFRFYRDTITFDHQTGKVIIATVINSDDNPQDAYQTATDRINNIIEKISQATTQQHSAVSQHKNSSADIAIDITDKDYCAIVDQAKKHIINGDIFQVVLSREFSIKTASHPFEIYRALRFCNPSPYMFYLETDDFTVAGASPEKLITVEDGVIESRPLAGTRPRSNPANDEAVATELLSDDKEVAEHMMLVDLARNDVGAVAEPGTVKVVKLKEIEKYSRVMHISSTVQGKLHQNLSAMDALRIAFPAGTLSGAPKIRAMEIIDQLERSRRGIYGGAVCAFDSLDNLISCIVIRTVLVQNNTASIRAGAGIVFDSHGQTEANETQHKASATLHAIQSAMGENI
ncbi:MAG: anthranilate synthase component I [Pseudomonadota bacterium]